MSDEQKPTIELRFERALCQRHGEPFRANWPSGYSMFVCMAIDRVMADPEIAARCGGDVAKIHEVLDQRPLCCILPADELVEVYRANPIAKMGHCQNCRNHGLGTPYAVMTPQGRMDYRHLCFWCVIHRMRPLKPK